jgi:hypothetical protein
MLSRPLLAALGLAALGLAGCNPAAKAVGKWEVDFSQAAAPAENSAGPLAAAMASMASVLKIQWEFQADGTCHFTGGFVGQSITSSGQWRYAKTDGSALVLMVKRDGDNKEQELRLDFQDHDHFEIVPPEGAGGRPGQKLPFKRIKS